MGPPSGDLVSVTTLLRVSNHPNMCSLVHSSVLGRNSFIGFYFDLTFETVSSLANFVAIIASGSSYIGIYLYIDGMVKDSKRRLMAIDPKSTNGANQEELWPIYVGEIKLHVEIIGYVSNDQKLSSKNCWKFEIPKKVKTSS